MIGSVDRQCTGKRTYKSKSDAKRAIKRAATAHGGAKDYSRLNAYRCPHCDGWHFGHRPRRS